MIFLKPNIFDIDYHYHINTVYYTHDIKKRGRLSHYDNLSLFRNVPKNKRHITLKNKKPVATENQVAI